MDSNLPSSPPSGADAKAAFRKHLSDGANRKYRRRSPVSGSFSSDDSPKPERSSSPIPSREKDHSRKDDGRDFDRDSGRSQHGRSGDSYRHFDRPSYRSSQSHRRYDDYNRHGKHTDDNERDHSKFSSRSGRASRGGTNFDYRRRESEHNISGDHLRDVDKYSVDKSDGSGHRRRDKDKEMSSLDHQRHKDKESLSDRGTGRRHYNSKTEDVKSDEWDRHKEDRDGQDEKRHHRRSFGNNGDDCSPTYGEPKGHHNDSTSRRDVAGRPKEASRSDPKELGGGQKYKKEEKKKYDDDSNRHKELYSKEPAEQESPAKKAKLFGLDGSTDHGKHISKFTAVADESASSKQAQESFSKVTSEQDYVKDSDIDAAKVAAMKAAELVNRNLIGTGYMSTDQKKKLLWGNKKNATAEEPAHHWGMALSGDRERQEKFNKLMSLRLPWPIVGSEGRYKSGAATRKPRWQWPPSGREAKGTSAGFGEAIHCWTSSERWPHSWTRSLRTYFECFFNLHDAILAHIILKKGFFLIFYVAMKGKCDLLLEICDHDEKVCYLVYCAFEILMCSVCQVVWLTVCLGPVLPSSLFPC